MEIILERFIDIAMTTSLDLEPKDYLYCNTEEELRRCVKDDLEDYEDLPYIEDKDIMMSDSILNIPDEFIKEWNILKATSENQESN